ncbi:Mariner Mos1 transposase [Eumeta japonica]|uniref:Mariner Mos1 transposase n=1 Tax=Eumeta variegata TaxID=151549 RepID=A0A4C1YIQ6_EUMVA|nr:Mariner Mos1 transposase [Eumeta japonica]
MDQDYGWKEGGDFELDDKERPGLPKKFEDEELQGLFDIDSCESLQELATSLAVVLSTVGKRLKTMGMIQKQGYWVPYELKLRDIERRFLTCELLLERQKRKDFLHQIVTGDEKWIHFDNPKRRKSWVKPDQPSTSVAKQKIAWIQASALYLVGSEGSDLLRTPETK